MVRKGVNKLSSIKKNLRRLRGELDLTQKEFAKLIDMPLSTYRKKERGETYFTIEEAYTIANAVSKSIDEIFLISK